jgi:DMSO/TMAO reductase YedYZ molybdopterin-dependent catalytic subunit
MITHPARVNPPDGVPDDPVPDDYKLTVTDRDGKQQSFTIEQLRAMPSKTITTEFRCVEGWSQVVQWTGVPLAEFLVAHRLVDLKDLERGPKYLRMETADASFYVGWDLASAMHPQTLLAYTMNGEPLSVEHGAPLRLLSPVKYGYKNIKWLTAIKLTDDFPADYWGDQGYDWYGGL